MRMNLQALTILALTAGLGASTALAQNQVIDGRQLDRNLRVGSGGVNDNRRVNTAGVYQNALVTGNVAGLARFRADDIDYRAPGEFTATTGADDTYLFRLQSQTPGLTSRSGQMVLPSGSPATFQSGYNTGSITLRAGSGVTSGEISGQYDRYASGLTIRRDDLGAVSAHGASALNLSLDAHALTGKPMTDTVGFATDKSGQLLQITASPLVGIRQQPLGQPTPMTQQQMTKDNEAKNPPLPDAVAPAGTNGSPEVPKVDAKGDPLDPTGSQQVDRGRISPLNVAPGLMLGRQLNTQIEATVEANSAPRFRTEELEQAILAGNTDANAQPGQNVYQDLLASIRGGGAATPGTNGGIPADQLAGKPAVNPDDDTTPKSEVDRVADAFAKTQEAIAKGNEDTQTTEQKLEALVKKLDYNLPPLKTLAGSENNAFDAAMMRGQKLMTEGKFFDAEDAFAAGVTLRPKDPMAQIGQLHAQLGAGLYQTASGTLRRILLAHPELIATRYQPPVLPSDDRLNHIEDDLQDLLQNNPRADAPLLLAYLAYQRGFIDTASHALDVMASRNPRDELLPLLRRIWLSAPHKIVEHDKPEAPPAQTPPKPAEKPAKTIDSDEKP
ncbi:MAG: hypothetical protein GC162_13085 [Planctomycetes bacterium]|nr:hypothetical protein [Planctomycetota bacterium]